MFPKVTSVRQFRLNSSLYVSGPTGRAGAPRSFFLCGTMPENASRRRTTTTQLTPFCFFFLPILNNPKSAWALYVRCRLHQIHISFNSPCTGKPTTERFNSDFVEPVLLLPARRAVPHSRPTARRGFCFWNRRHLLTPRILCCDMLCFLPHC